MPADRSARGVGSRAGVALALAALVGAATACHGAGGAGGTGGGTPAGVISAVGAENQYANVLAQIGGRYVSVSSVLDNPNTDPHTFEASPSIAEEVSSASIIVQNGLGYDGFMDSIEAASPTPGRKVIVVQDVLGLPSSTPNPHLWYDPRTMVAVAKVMASDLGALQPSHVSYFQAKLREFDASLRPWFRALASFKTKHPGIAAASTEPVADYLLSAMGIDNMTPFRLQVDVMNGIDPAPQDVALERSLLSRRAVKLFCYNEQVVDPLTVSLRDAALADGVPVVAVYETMPEPGYDYQSWMLAEVNAISRALTDGVSTEHL